MDSGDTRAGQDDGALQSQGFKELLTRWGPLAVAFFLLYGSTFVGLVHDLWMLPDYSYGFFVPLFSAALLWQRRESFPHGDHRGSWWGLIVLGFAALVYLAAIYLKIPTLERLSMVPTIAGMVFFVGGWPVFRWSGAAIGFLVFMVPPPVMLVNVWSQPLQRIGTIVSTATMQLLNIPAFSQGNVIVLRNAQIGVVEACSGLRIMMLFLAVCIGAALIIDRPVWEKWLIAFSAIPNALIANVTRILITAILHEYASHEFAEGLFHDLAGWFAMPMAVAMLFLELFIARKIREKLQEWEDQAWD